MTETYKEICLSEIEGQITTYPTQPIIFAGAGLSKRWFGAPSWPELLEQCVNDCPEISKSLAYFSQSCKEYPEIATAISDYYREWAWNSGSNSFPDALFEAGVDREEYLKYWVAKKFLDLGLDTAHLSEDFLPESAAFQSIRPHAIITTNYDRALEGIFPDYEPISRDELIPRAYSSVGEIVKIHGCATDHRSLVLTRRDYDDFLARRKYLSAKLLTYFNEHPILIVGYSASDPNIAGILSDIDEALAMPGELIQNIFLLERAPSSGLPQTERLIQVSDNRSVRVRTIQSNDWEWVFKAFSHRAPLENVNPRILRSILARSFNLVRSDIPKQTLEVDFDFIEGSIESDEAFAKLFGIASLSSGSELSARYKYTLTQVSKKLGYNTWHRANQLLGKIRDEKAVDIKASDNRYHMTIQIGQTKFQKYSEECVDLLKSVKAGDEYEIKAD